MISASMASYKSRYQKKQNEILEQIEKKINEAIDNGTFECRYGMCIDTEQDIRDAIQKELESLGYKVSMPKKEIQYGPSDQTPWYDYVDISWNRYNEI